MVNDFFPCNAITLQFSDMFAILVVCHSVKDSESDNTAAIAAGSTVAVVTTVLVAITVCCIAIFVWHHTKHKRKQ